MPDPIPLLLLMPINANRLGRIAAGGFAPILAPAPETRRNAIRGQRPSCAPC